MKNLPSTIPVSSVPVVDQGSSMALAAAMNLLTRDYPAQPGYMLEPLAAPHRAVLDRRKRQVEAWLAPAPKSDHPRLCGAIGEMLGSFLAGSSGERAVVAKWLQVVQDLPSWAILDACSKIELGEADGASLDYRPSAPRLRDVARNGMLPWLEELAHLRAVLSAEALEPQDAEMRGRIGGLLMQLSADLKMSAKKPKTQGSEVQTVE